MHSYAADMVDIGSSVSCRQHQWPAGAGTEQKQTLTDLLLIWSSTLQNLATGTPSLG